MNEELKAYLFQQLEHHLTELDEHLQSESDFEIQSYHMEQMKEILKRIKQGDPCLMVLN